MIPTANDRPANCEWCKAPHDKVVPTSHGGQFYAIEIESGAYGYRKDGSYGPVKDIAVFDRKGERRHDVEMRGGSNMSTERVWLTQCGNDKISLWLCTYCRSELFKRKAAGKPKIAPDALFDNLDEIDAKGKAQKEAAHKAKRERNIPVTSGYDGENL